MVDDVDVTSAAERRNRSVTKTYRYLRIGIVVLAVYLSVSVVVEMGWGRGWLGSVSEYYYTPVRNVLVGTLTAMAIGLVAVKARDNGGEDVMLNVAGMLAPVVALVPLPIRTATPCPDERERCIPAEFLPGVENNVAALLVVGFLGLVAVWGIALAQKRFDEYRSALLACAGVYVAFTLWFVLDEEYFPLLAHYVAAVPMFGLVCLVALLNARSMEGDPRTYPVWSNRTYAHVYRWIARGIAAVLVLAVVAGVLNWVNEVDPFPHWVFMVEAALLVLFAGFWVVQTVQFWHEGIPDE